MASDHMEWDTPGDQALGNCQYSRMVLMENLQYSASVQDHEEIKLSLERPVTYSDEMDVIANFAVSKLGVIHNKRPEQRP